MPSPMYEMARDMALDLEPQEKLALAVELIEHARGEVQDAPKKPYPDIRGALADLGPAPSFEDFMEARREAWASTRREDADR